MERFRNGFERMRLRVGGNEENEGSEGPPYGLIDSNFLVLAPQRDRGGHEEEWGEGMGRRNEKEE